jgi:hypothetical protein
MTDDKRSGSSTNDPDPRRDQADIGSCERGGDVFVYDAETLVTLGCIRRSALGWFWQRMVQNSVVAESRSFDTAEQAEASLRKYLMERGT